MIDEHIVSRMLSEYKSYFPREEAKHSSGDSEPAYYTSPGKTENVSKPIDKSGNLP